MSEFIKVEKDGEVIEIAPPNLADHIRLGWKPVVVEDAPKGEAKPEAERVPVTAEKPIRKK